MAASWMRRWAKAEGGVALIEFAIALPVLLLLLFGTMEAANYYLFRQKLESAATQILNVVNQNTNVNAASLNNLYNALPAMMTPYVLPSSRIIITQIQKAPGAACRPIAAWQYLTGGSVIAPTVGGLANTGAIQLNTGDSVMTIELFTSYVPYINTAFTRGILGNLTNIRVESYQHTRYGAFGLNPVTGASVAVPCV